MPAERRNIIRSVGFNFARVAVDFGPLLSAADNYILDELIDDVMAGVKAYIASGLKVIIVNFAPAERSLWSDVLDGVSGPALQRLAAVWQRFAAVIGANTEASNVAVEIFNEPPSAQRGRDPWPIQQKYLFERIRAVMPRHTIIVTGDNLSAIDRLVTLNSTDFDGNTMYRFNGYEPFQISHQGDGYYKYIRRLTFPPQDHPGGRAQAIADVTAAIKADNNLSLVGKVILIAKFTVDHHIEGIDTYFDTPCDAEFIAHRIKVATDWAAAQGLSCRKLFVGEFGARGDFNGAYIVDGPDDVLAGSITTRVNFYRTWRQKIESAQLGGWCAHELSGPDGMGLGLGKPPWTFRPELMEALGLGILKQQEQ